MVTSTEELSVHLVLSPGLLLQGVSCLFLCVPTFACLFLLPSYMSASVLEYIDQQYTAMSTSTSMKASTPEHSKEPAVGDVENIRKKQGKRKCISPILDTSGSFLSPPECLLSSSEEKIHSAVLSTLAAWMGEMQHVMQQSLNKQFEEGMERLKNELLQDANVADSAGLMHSVSHTAESVHDLHQENSDLRQKCRILEGRLVRAEKEISEVKEQLLMQEARSMRDNLVFFNIPESKNESCEGVLRKFLMDEMKISESDMKKIRFDRVHRSGQHHPNQQGHPRVMVAKFNPYEGRQIVLSHVKNLDKTKNFGVNEQLPRQMAERKKQLLPRYKDARLAKKDVRWNMDKLVIEGKTQAVQKDKIRSINLDSTEKTCSLQVRHTPPHTDQGNSFQGHSVSIESQDDIIPALHAVYADPRVARAAHNIYAYRIRTPSGQHIEHYEDDGEWGAGARVLKLLQDSKVENKLVCVTRWNGANHLGRIRFNHIVNAARNSLDLV